MRLASSKIREIGKKSYFNQGKGVQNGDKIDSKKMFHYNPNMKEILKTKSSPENNVLYE